MPAAAVTAVTVSEDPCMYEIEHVHAVYDEIAPHFSSTRYKPWPIIAQFLSSLPTGWVGLDSGTGNGKYLPLPLDRPGSVWTIGLDRSFNLLEMARVAGEGTLREVVWGDVLDRSWRDGSMDYAISIATIHHLSTHLRRKSAVQRLLQCVSPSHGRVLIYVWAIEQDEFSKRSIPLRSNLERLPVCYGESTGQDVFVPWVLSPKSPSSKPKPAVKTLLPLAAHNGEEGQADPKVFHRYYHMFGQGELSALVREAATDLELEVGPPTARDDPVGFIRRGIEIVQDCWERSNYYVELRCWTI